MKQKPYSESCLQNCEPIFSVIEPLLSSTNSLLEIGSGTGQHAVYFSERLSHLKWQTSDCLPYLEGIGLWIDGAELENVLLPIELDVAKSNWPSTSYDAIYMANTIHIMHASEVEIMFTQLANHLESEGQLIIYGPFNYDGQYTSESNQRFDQWLKNRDANSGIKNFEDIHVMAKRAGLSLENDYEMPANNRILHFLKD